MDADWLVQILTLLVTDYTLRYVSLGSAILGVASGALGCFVVLRRQSLVGAALSHAALPGIAIAFLIVGVKDQLSLLLGAGIAAWIGMLVIVGIVRTTRIKQDAALGIVLSTFFGFGVVLLTFIRGSPLAGQAGLDRYLFGQAAALIEQDVIILGAIGVACIAILALLFKEFKLLTFDQDFAASMGFKVKHLDILLTSLIVLAVVIGLQTVGVILMVAMLIAPAAAARQWTDNLKRMIVLSAVFGATSGLVGALVSSMAPRIPTGPVIILVVAVILVISFLFSAKRGYLWSLIRKRRPVTEDGQKRLAGLERRS